MPFKALKIVFNRVSIGFWEFLFGLLNGLIINGHA